MSSDTQKSELEKDQAEKLRMVIDYITKYSKEDDEREEFRAVAVGLKRGDKLTGKSLEGSSNYSYKVSLEDDPSVAFFVKVSLTYALWNPDRSAFYSLDRLTTEYEMMKKFSNLLGKTAPVASPFLCVDIASDVRMMVTQWAPSHEPWASQFLTGKVDRRIIPKLAEFVAAINLEKVENPKFNEEIKTPMRALYPISKAIFAQMIATEEEPDHFVVKARELGEDRFAAVIDAMGEAYEKQEMLLHGDLHCLNILVEPSSKEGHFASKAEFILCDWEMVHVGVTGRDQGTFNAFPIVSAYFLAAQGFKQSAYDLIERMKEFWDEYADIMIRKGSKDDEFLRGMFRSAIGWCGLYLFIANVMLKAQWNYMPFDKISEKAGKKVIASVSLTGMRYMEFSFLQLEPQFSLSQLREWFRELIADQIDLLVEICKGL